MAFINVKHATVGNANSKGFTLIESYKDRNGEEQSTYYKVWTSEQHDQGSIVDVSGVVTFRVSEYEGKHRGEIHINNPRISVPSAPTPAATPAPAAAEDAPF